jgi:uncharacterized protein (TIGR01777 family)
MATVLVTGGTGLIGQALTNALIAKRHEVIVLTRNLNDRKTTKRLRYALWDANAQTMDKYAIAQADFIIHLAGANVADGRWTEKRKQEIRDSRVRGGELLVKVLQEIPNAVKAVISASATGWYGPDPVIPNSKPFTENDPAATDFLGSTCKQWEESIQPVTELGKRLVLFRTGIVLSNRGGAYAEFKKPLRFGVASVLGNGRQMISWIHIDDIVQLYINALESDSWQGVYNTVAPQPASNKQLITAMAKQRGRFYMTTHVPELALKTALGEMSIEVLKSTTVSASKLEKRGYPFLFPHIDTAVRNLHKNASV